MEMTCRTCRFRLTNEIQDTQICCLEWEEILDTTNSCDEWEVAK